MDLRVTSKGIEDMPTLKQDAGAKVTAALDRFQDHIQHVTVLLEDETGPHKQSVDKRCRIDLRLTHGGNLTVDEVSEDIVASLDVALDRLKVAIGRKVGKAKRGIGAG